MNAASSAPMGGSEGRHDQTLVILGAQGDLTSRLLLPGLGGLVADSSMQGLLLVGSGRREWSDDQWRSLVVEAFESVDARGPAVDAVVETTRYVAADASDEDDLRRLLDIGEGRLTLYFALSPTVTIDACHALARIGVPPGTRLVLEKPFGVDMASAADLNELLRTLRQLVVPPHRPLARSRSASRAGLSLACCSDAGAA